VQTPAPKRDERTIALEEIPVWEVDERVRHPFLCGQHAQTRAERLPKAKYPAFQSSTPLFGQTRFENAAPLGKGSGGFHFAFDHSQGTPGIYDILYFDENGDGDLTDDIPRRVWREAPRGLVSLGIPEEGIYFEPVKVSFDFGPQGPRAVELLPHLWFPKHGMPRFRLIPTRLRRGRFEIDGTSCEVFLGHWGVVTGRFDLPSTALVLLPQGGQSTLRPGGDRLNTAHRLRGRYYRFSCTPTGDQLFIRPYDGPLGVLELGAGGRGVEKLDMEGCVVSPEMVVMVSDDLEGETLEPIQRCRIPVGDYAESFLLITLGDVRFVVSHNCYHTDTQGSGEPVASFRIREDKPFILDFSNKPAVTFLQPEPQQRVALGDDLHVDAALVDPVLDLLIRGIEDMTHPEPEALRRPRGIRARERGAPLEPTVVIRRANGDKVVQDGMRFG
jgi:hypothetical protein